MWIGVVIFVGFKGEEVKKFYIMLGVWVNLDCLNIFFYVVRGLRGNV